jgi:neutral amino acid transport system permease protein
VCFGCGSKVESSGDDFREFLENTRLGNVLTNLSNRFQTLRKIFIFALLCIFLSLFGVSRTSAAESDLGISGQLKYRTATGESVFVTGVTVSVEGSGSVTTDETGSFRIPVPGPGEYRVLLDTSTLPDTVSLKDVSRDFLNVNLSTNKDQVVIFALQDGSKVASPESTFALRRVVQLSVEGIKFGLYLALASVGLSLIFGTTGLVNFAHAELVTFGNLMGFFFNYYGFAGAIGFLAPLPAPLGSGSNLVIAAALTMVAGGILGYGLNRFIFRPARRSGVSLLAQMVMTIGGSILLRYIFLYFFTGGTRAYRSYSAQRANEFLGIFLTPKDIASMLVSVVILLIIGFGLKRTRSGRAMRAVSDNRDLSESSGIDVEKVISQVWTTGAALASLAGIFLGLDAVTWESGFRILLFVFAAVTLGGLGTAFGALFGALIVGLVINLSTLFIDVELKNMMALLVLVVVLMFKPQGLFGRKERIG